MRLIQSIYRWVSSFAVPYISDYFPPCFYFIERGFVRKLQNVRGCRSRFPVPNSCIMFFLVSTLQTPSTDQTAALHRTLSYLIVSILKSHFEDWTRSTLKSQFLTTSRRPSVHSSHRRSERVDCGMARIRLPLKKEETLAKKFNRIHLRIDWPRQTALVVSDRFFFLPLFMFSTGCPHSGHSIGLFDLFDNIRSSVKKCV